MLPNTADQNMPNSLGAPALYHDVAAVPGARINGTNLFDSVRSTALPWIGDKERRRFRPRIWRRPVHRCPTSPCAKTDLFDRFLSFDVRFADGRTRGH